MADAPAPGGGQEPGTDGREQGPDGRSMSGAELQDIYADKAAWLDRLAPLDRLTTGRSRRRAFGDARGRVLDVACGTGLNRRYLPEGVEYVGVDLSPAMVSKAATIREGEDPDAAFMVMDAQALSFPADSFDTVVSSLSTCTFPDPVAALDEMARVVHPDGRVLLLEHGRSSVGPIARFQDWRADAHFEKHGCRWTQEPLDVVAGAALTVESSRTGPLGILTAIEARPD